MRLRLLGGVLLAALSLACGGDNGGSPTGPSSTTTQPSTQPRATIPQLGGTWTGTHEMSFSGERTFSYVAITLDQGDRLVRGTWRLTSPGWDINGTVDLTILGEGSTARLTGTGTIGGETASGTGRCSGFFELRSEGAVSNNSLRLVAPNITLTNCRNTVSNIVWIVGR